MRLEAMAVKIPPVEGHPNRVPFEGVLTMVNTASDKAPAGARGHRVMLTRDAAEKALPSLLGMAVDYRPGWDGATRGRGGNYKGLGTGDWGLGTSPCFLVPQSLVFSGVESACDRKRWR